MPRSTFELQLERGIAVAHHPGLFGSIKKKAVATSQETTDKAKQKLMINYNPFFLQAYYNINCILNHVKGLSWIAYHSLKSTTTLGDEVHIDDYVIRGVV
jgi:hypothetical protein